MLYEHKDKYYYKHSVFKILNTISLLQMKSHVFAIIKLSRELQLLSSNDNSDYYLMKIKIN
jgi:hypothetical protein